MHIIDWMIVGAYIAVSLSIGIYFTRKASQNTTHYFIAGRTLSWFMAGTAIAATTFSSDTPLVVAGISRQSGISGHWFWLSAAIGQAATIFFFARLWRRTEAMTDIEFVAKRYEPSLATTILRIFKVFFDGILINCMVMASVTLGMGKILKTMLDLPDGTLLHVPVFGDIGWVAVLLIILGGITLLYSALSGLYGAVYTGLLQFILAIAGSTMLAVFVYVKACHGEGVMGTLEKIPNFKAESMNFIPPLNSSALMMFTFFVYVLVTWWHRVPGNGYYVQRLLATRSEKDSVYAFLWFNICQYVIRPWPWIVVGLFSLYYLPGLKDPESSFPAMINLFSPVGFKGIMVAAMLAAYMSTIDSHLNWGASYVINDLYCPFINNNKSTHFYVVVSRLCTILLTVITLIISTKLTSMLETYKYISVIFGGIDTVMIARWYWWRVNAYSELSAITASLIIANILQIAIPNTAGIDLYAVRLVITVCMVSVIWIVVTLLTSSENPTDHVIDFYSKIRVPGPGWKRVREYANISLANSDFGQSVVGWLSCVVFLYSLMIGIGKLIFHQWLWGIVCLIVASLAGCVVRNVMVKMKM